MTTQSTRERLLVQHSAVCHFDSGAECSYQADLDAIEAEAAARALAQSADALQEAQERVGRLEAAGLDWHEKAKTETNTSLHRMGHRNDLEAIRADNEASEALYQAEDRLRGLFDPEWHALAQSDSTGARE